jgi:hypothetical protein
MASLLDTLGAIVLASVLALNILVMHEAVAARSNTGHLHLMAQSSADAMVNLMETEIRKAGYNVAVNTILQADSTHFRFRADLDGDGSPDTLSYQIGSPADASQTPNPADRYLIRERSGEAPVQIRAGFTEFRFTYFTDTGDSTLAPADLGSVRKIRVDAMVESTVPYDTTFARTRLRLAVRPYHLGS